MNRRLGILSMLRYSKDLYVLMSDYTRMPYVYCAPDTYDDEIFLYFREDDARFAAKKMDDSGEPVYLSRITEGARLYFFTTLYTMDVNALLVDRGLATETFLNLSDLVIRPKTEELPPGKLRIENPQLHLTALYFVQEYRKNPGRRLTEELLELNEEMMANFRKGTYLVAAQGTHGLAIVRQNNGHIYQVVFTDYQEFHKFNSGGEYRMAVLEGSEAMDHLPEDSSGVVLNPSGINLLLDISGRK